MKRAYGIIYLLVSGLLFSMMALFLKISNSPVADKVFFRSFINLLILLPFAKPSLKVFFPCLKRSIFGIGSMVLSYWSLSYIGVSENVLLVYAAPVWTLLILRVNIFPFGILAGASFLGLLFLKIHSFSDGNPVGLIMAALSGFCASLAYVEIKKMKELHISSVAIVFNFVLLGVIVGMVWKIFSQETHLLSLPNIDVILGGLCACFAQIALTKAYEHINALEGSFYISFAPIFGAILGKIFLQESVGVLEILGMLMVVGSAFLISRTSLVR